ncbi:hypothetical protein YC2023_099515 [Brassica napus]
MFLSASPVRQTAVPASQSIASGFLRFWDSLNFKKDREFVGITVLFLDEKVLQVIANANLEIGKHSIFDSSKQDYNQTNSSGMTYQQLIFSLACLTSGADETQHPRQTKLMQPTPRLRGDYAPSYYKAVELFKMHCSSCYSECINKQNL